MQILIQFCLYLASVFCLELSIRFNIRLSLSVDYEFRPQLFLVKVIFPCIRYAVMSFDAVARETPTMLAVVGASTPTRGESTICLLSKSATILHCNKELQNHNGLLTVD
ncbi:hypothetical protein AVEN_122243-1 [Araneus ventricosus]|uniref:Uncharacterized protein n=1 Tax=Araneus ventricosus TaxID=182803 RepID=A0A4Y2HAH4_ARAVE|nr:hypothetical protein AVEN_122243-1 [Araneus ventricosus]